MSPLAAAVVAGAAVAGLAGGPLLLRAAATTPGVRASGRRRVVVATVTAVVSAALAARLVGEPYGRYAIPGFLGLAAAGVVLAVIDLDTRRLPDAVTLPAYPVLLLLFAAASWLAGDWPALLRGVVTGAVAFALYGTLALLAPHGLGMGDVKLAGLLGLASGWLSVATAVVAAVLGFTVGAAVALTMVARRRATMRTAVPFGPSMLVGAWLAVLAGDRIAAAYLMW